jgi:MHS family proline/betaine transporter-like MFS transporter
MSLLAVIWAVFAGWLSDRVGRKPLLLIASVGLVLLTYPLFAFLAAQPSLTRLLIIQTVFALLIATYTAVTPAMLAELFPTRVRNTALALSYNIAVAIFGGFGQLIVAWLIIRTGDVLAPAYYVTAASVVGVVAVLPLTDRTGSALE